MKQYTVYDIKPMWLRRAVMPFLAVACMTVFIFCQISIVIIDGVQDIIFGCREIWAGLKDAWKNTNVPRG